MKVFCFFFSKKKCFPAPINEASLFFSVGISNRAELAIYPGGAHGFTLFPGPLPEAANARSDAFLAACIA